MVAIIVLASLILVGIIVVVVLFFVLPQSRTPDPVSQGEKPSEGTIAGKTASTVTVKADDFGPWELHPAYAEKMPVKGWEKDFGTLVTDIEIKGDLMMVTTVQGLELYEYNDKTGPGKKLLSHEFEDRCYLWEDGLGCGEKHIGVDGTTQSWNEYLNVSWLEDQKQPAWEGEYIQLLYVSGDSAYFSDPNGWGWGFFRTEGKTPVAEAYLDVPVNSPEDFIIIDAVGDAVLYQVSEGGVLGDYALVKMQPYLSFEGTATPVLMQAPVDTNAELLQDGVMVYPPDFEQPYEVQLYDLQGKMVDTESVPAGIRLDRSLFGTPTRREVQEGIAQLSSQPCQEVNVLSFTGGGVVMSIDNGANMRAVLSPDGDCTSKKGLKAMGSWGKLTGDGTILYGTGMYLSIPRQESVLGKDFFIPYEGYFEFGSGGKLFSVDDEVATQWLPVA